MTQKHAYAKCMESVFIIYELCNCFHCPFNKDKQFNSLETITQMIKPILWNVSCNS